MSDRKRWTPRERLAFISELAGGLATAMFYAALAIGSPSNPKAQVIFGLFSIAFLIVSFKVGIDEIPRKNKRS